MSIEEVKKIELKPCPFCGGEAELTEQGNLYVGISKSTIRCKGCGTKQVHRWIKYKFDIIKIEELTIELWNKRMENKDDR